MAFRIIGAIVLFIDITNRVLLVRAQYPYHWEYVPLHLCRLLWTLIGLLLLFGRIEWIKYLVIPALIGATVTIFSGDLKSDYNWKSHHLQPYSQGIDSYFYWDYYITHMGIASISLVCWCAVGFNMGAKNVTTSFLVLSITGLFIYILNIILYHIGIDSNYFYLGHDSFHLHPLWFSEWPWNLFYFTILSVVVHFSIFGIYLSQKNFDFRKWKRIKPLSAEDIFGQWDIKFKKI